MQNLRLIETDHTLDIVCDTGNVCRMLAVTKADRRREAELILTALHFAPVMAIALTNCVTELYGRKVVQPTKGASRLAAINQTVADVLQAAKDYKVTK